MSLILKYDLGNPHRLPVGYTPLAYIECTGTLWIDTGWKPGSSNIRVIIKAELEKQSSQLSTERGLFGNYSAGKGIAVGYYGMYWYSGLNCSGTWRNVNVTGGIKSLNATFDFITNSTKTEFRVDDGYNSSTSYVYSNASNEASPDNCYLGKPRSENNGVPWLGKIYYCIINDNNVKVKELVPAKRNSDGVIGMFDIVSQTFKTNVGTGAFIAGPEVVVLPYEYLLVEYLEALPKSSYINTGVKPSANLGTELGYCGIDLGSSENIFFGASNLSGYAGNPNYCMETCGNTLNIAFNTGYLSVSFTANSGQRYKLQLNINGDKQYKIDGVVKITFSANDNLPTNYNLFLFKRSVSGGGNDSYNVYTTRLEYCKMWDGTTLVRNMIPCYRRSDLKPGMYDTVNNVFYTNSGSGEFILGPVVEESSRLLEYNNAGSNYIGKPINIHHSTSNPSTTQINEGSGDFNNSVIVLNGGLPTTSKTICFWMYLASIPGTTIVYMDSNTGSCFSIDSQVNIGASTAKGSYNKSILKVGWQHITIDLLNWNLYVDGILLTKNSGSGYYNPTNGSNLNIGKRIYNGTYDYPFNGCLYDFRVYDNVLTADEVLQIYKGGV